LLDLFFFASIKGNKGQQKSLINWYLRPVQKSGTTDLESPTAVALGAKHQGLPNKDKHGKDTKLFADFADKSHALVKNDSAPGIHLEAKQYGP